MPRPRINRLRVEKRGRRLPPTSVLQRKNGRKPAVKFAKATCLNCATVVSFENAGRKLSEPLHQRNSRSHVEKILEDRSASDPSSVREVLDVIFDLSERAAAAGRRLDERNSILCWKCTMILRQLHKLFGEFVEAAVDPSLMTAVYGQSCPLAEFQAGLHEVSSPLPQSDGDEDFCHSQDIKQEPISEEEDYAPMPPPIRRETRIPRSCKKTLNYKRLNMGKSEEESDVDTEYILPESSKKRTPIRIRALAETVSVIPKKRRRKTNPKVSTEEPSEPVKPSAKEAERTEDDLAENPGSPLPPSEDAAEGEPKKAKAKRKPKTAKDGKENTPKVPCPVCKKNQVTEELLQVHLESKHVPYTRVKTHHCPDCAKMFWSKHDLKNHIFTHTREACYTCDKCDYKTKRPQELSRHQKLVHLNEKNFHCDVCNKGYALKWQLTDHARVHKDERAFPCTAPNCDKSFRTPSNLRQHLELHKGSKYVCHVCGLAYSRKAYLRLHVNAAHLGKPFPIARKRVLDPLKPARPRLPRTKIIDASHPPRVKKPRSETAYGFGQASVRRLNYPVPMEKSIKNYVRILPNTTISVEDGSEMMSNENDERILVLTEYNPEVHDLQLMTEDQMEVEEDEEVIEGEVVEVIEQEEDDGEIKMVEVHMELEEENMTQEGEDVETEGNEVVEEHHYAITDDQQIICYPISSLGVVQNVPVAISTALAAAANNTFYITAQQSSEDLGDGHGSTIVYNPFQEFMSLQ